MKKPRQQHKWVSVFWLAVRFGIVGLGSIGIYFGALFAAQAFITNTIALTLTAYVTSAIFNFVLQNFFTFRADAIGASRVLKYVLMHLLCMTINSGLMFVFVDLMEQNLYLSQLVVTAIVAAVSFGLSYVFVYAR